MLRALPRIRSDALGFLRESADRYGDLVEFPIPGQKMFFANHPDAVKQLLQTEHRTHDRQTVQYKSLSLITGNGLLTSDGELWKRQRRLMQPAFHRAVLDHFVEHIDVAVDRLVASWSPLPPGAEVDVDEAMMRTALEAVGRSLFSHDLSGEASELVRAVLRALDVVVARARSPFPLPMTLPTPGNVALRNSLRTLDRTVQVMVSARRLAEQRGAQPQTPDLLGMLLASEGFDDRQLSDEIVTLIVAGHETVATALTWTFYLLGQHKSVLSELQSEVETVLSGRRPTFADLPALSLTRQVVDEALRLYPPAWVISRRALTPGELLGQEIPVGSYVFVSPYVLQRTQQWWPQPDRFDPARFAPQEPGPAYERYAYIPFGAGPNLCIGRDLALLEAVLVVAAVVQRFELTPMPDHEVRLDPLVTIRPKGGLPMRIRRRS